jgi:nucleoside-diphosphate-sugar epimerase
MRVFVTGASGFIGKAVVKELLRSGHSVVGLARSDEAAQEVAALGAVVQRGSLQDLHVLKTGASTSDGVIHLAFNHDFTRYAQSCQEDQAAIQAMADALAGTDRPLIITSGTMLLPHGIKGHEDDAYDASSPMFAARGASEALALSLVSKGSRTAIMRLAPVVHGDGDRHMFMSNLISIARERQVSAYIGDGLNRWPAVHCLDAAVAYRLALEKTSAGATYHVVAEEAVRFRDIAEAIGRKLGLPVESKAVDEAEAHFGWFASLAGTDNPVSNEKTRGMLQWSPQQRTLIDDLENGSYFEE